MAQNDIKVPKENASGTFDEVVLTGTQIGLEKPATGNASSTQVVLGNDTRLSDARTPSSTLAHAASHAAGGSDPLAPSDIQAQSIFSVESLVITTTTQVTLTAARAKIYDVVQYAGAQVDVKLPSTNALQGDIIVLRWGTGGDSIRIIQSASGSPITTVSSGEQKRFIRGATDTWSLVPVDTHTHPATAISDSTTAGRALLTGADAAAQRTSLGLGTAATSASGDFAAASHAHGNINSSGQVGSTSGLPLKTGTAGVVEAGAFGTSAGTFCEGNDGRLSNARTPTAHTHAASDITSGLAASATTDTTNASNISSGTLSPSRMGSGTPSASNYLRGDGSWQAVAAGGVTSGSVDNAILRADGTGGSTSQGSDLNIEDATTTTANNVTISNQHSGQTNSSLVLTPKGTGAFIVGPKPDGVATVGGNARGSRAIDLQLERAAATQVASGANSFAAGLGCTASAIQSVAIGSQNTASGNYSFSVGRINTASAVRSACIGGQGGDSNRVGSVVFSVDEGSNGSRQRIHAMLRNNTTNATPTELWINPTDSYRFTIPSGKVVSGIINCLGVKSDGSQVAQYIREFCMKNVGGTTTLVSSSTIGTDTEDNASTDISVEANDTNDALRIYVTGGGSSETWRWVASVDAVETTYAS